MKVRGGHRLGSLNGGTGTFNVGRRLGFFVGSHVVYSGKMEKVINSPFQGFHGPGIDAEVLAGKVTNDRLHTAFINTPALTQLRQFVLGLFRSEEHTSELQSRENLVCRLLLEKKN